MDALLKNESAGDKVFNAVNVILITLLFVSVFYPMIYIVSASFSDSRAVVSGEVWLWPVRPTLDGYAAVFEYNQVWVGFKNSLVYTVTGTAINVFMTVLAAYPL